MTRTCPVYTSLSVPVPMQLSVRRLTQPTR